MITYTNSLIIVVEMAYSFPDIQTDTLLGDILVLDSRHSIHTVLSIVFLFVCLFVCLFSIAGFHMTSLKFKLQNY